MMIECTPLELSIVTNVQPLTTARAGRDRLRHRTVVGKEREERHRRPSTRNLSGCQDFCGASADWVKEAARRKWP